MEEPEVQEQLLQVQLTVDPVADEVLSTVVVFLKGREQHYNQQVQQVVLVLLAVMVQLMVMVVVEAAVEQVDLQPDYNIPILALGAQT